MVFSTFLVGVDEVEDLPLVIVLEDVEEDDDAVETCDDEMDFFRFVPFVIGVGLF